MITLKNTTDKQTFHIPRPVIDTEVVADFETPNVSISGNGFFQVAPSKGKRALSAVNLDVSVEQNNQNKTKTYTENGIYTIEAEEPYTGLGKVDVEVAIDTKPIYEDGYANGTMDQKSKLTTLSVASNGTYNNEDGYDYVNVDVQPNLQKTTVEYTENGKFTVSPAEGYDGLSKVTVKVNYDTSKIPFVVPMGVRFGCSTVENFPDNWDWSVFEQEDQLIYAFYDCDFKEAPKLALKNPNNLFGIFRSCSKMESADVSQWNTSLVTNMESMFDGCNRLKTLDISNWDTSNVTSFYSTFAGCTDLRTINFGTFDTKNCSNFQSIFSNCNNLVDIPEIDCSSNTSTYSTYSSPFYQCFRVRNFGGFKNINKTLYLNEAYSLTYESLINIINGLTDGVSGQTLYLRQECVNLLSDDDIAIATNKGWSISPARNITSPVEVTDLWQIPASTVQITFKTYDFSGFSGQWQEYQQPVLPNKSNLYVFEGDLSSTTSTACMFNNVRPLTFVKLTGLSNITYMEHMFSRCVNLREVYMDGDVSNVVNVDNMFLDITTEGTFYYNPAYDYSKIIAQLPSTWKAVPLE